MLGRAVVCTVWAINMNYYQLPRMCFSNIETFRRVRILFTYFSLKSWWHVQDWIGNVVLSLMNLLRGEFQNLLHYYSKKYWICSFLVTIWMCCYEVFFRLLTAYFHLFVWIISCAPCRKGGQNNILRSGIYKQCLCVVLCIIPPLSEFGIIPGNTDIG